MHRLTEQSTGGSSAEDVSLTVMCWMKNTEISMDRQEDRYMTSDLYENQPDQDT